MIREELKTRLVKALGLEYSYPSVKKELGNFSESYQTERKDFPEIDIIMPTFNRFRETKRSVENLIKLVEIPYKLIIVDGHSTDETATYLQELEQKHQSVKVITLDENYGGATARNEGLKLSMNKYVAFLDNDIFVFPYFFENLIETLEQQEVNVVAAQSKVVLPSKLIQINHPVFKIEEGWILFSDKDINKTYTDPSTLEQKICSWIPAGATLWKRAIFNTYNFDVKMGTSYEDNELTYSLHKDGYSFTNCPQALCLHVNANFAPVENQSDPYTKGRFGIDNVRASSKHFYKKHGLLFAFGDRTAYSKHLGFTSPDELKKFMQA